MQCLLGGPVPEIWPPVRTFYRSMTAIAVIYTRDGFIIAADGRCRAQATVDDLKKYESDEEQKIFHGMCAKRDVVFALTGWVLNPDRTYDLVSSTQRIIAELASTRFDSFGSYLEAIASNAGGVVSDAVNNNLVESSSSPGEGDDFAGIIVMSYFSRRHRDPSLGVIALSRNGTYGYEMFCPPKAHRFWGSEKILRLIDTGDDERLLRYFHPHDRSKSLEEAEELARAYVGACSDPVADEIDLACKNIGGHLHMALLSPGGYRWIEPPLQKTAGAQI